MDFETFPKIPRLFRGCVITEKIDGTNAQILVPDDPTAPLLAGSRNRWITPEHDNYGFAGWVAAHSEELRASLGPGRHYGEWWGAGIQRRYSTGEKRFSLFNVSRWAEPPSPCHAVPVLYTGPFSTESVRTVIQSLTETGSIASPGFMRPEGIVVWHEAARQLFKYTLGDDGHKG